MNEPLVLVIVVPLTGAVVTLLAHGRVLTSLAVLATVASVAAAVLLAVQVAVAGPQAHSVGGWSAPLGIELRADGLSATLVLMTAVVTAVVGLYAHAYFRSGSSSDARTDPAAWNARDAFWPLWLCLWGAMVAVFVSGDVFNIYVALELVILSAVALMTLGHGTKALMATLRYLLAAALGSAAYLLGVGLLYSEYGSLSLEVLGRETGVTNSTIVALALISAGLVLKTALFPMHFWLPRAHAFAPAPVSAVLSAVVVKASFYVLLRVWFDAAPGLDSVEVAQLFGLLGGAGFIWGSLQAIRATRLKMLVAHSTVAQVGLLFLLLPLFVTGSDGVEGRSASAWHGGIYHLLGHALAKASMFLAAGNVAIALGTDRISEMRGLVTCLPMTVLAFALAGVSLIGAPPLGGFVAKLLLLDAVATTEQWLYAAIILVGSLLTAVYVFRVVGMTMWGTDPPRGHDIARVPVSKTLEVPPLILAFGALALGLAASPVLRLLGDGPSHSVMVGAGG